MILSLAKEKIELDNEYIPVIYSTLQYALHYVVLGVAFYPAGRTWPVEFMTKRSSHGSRPAASRVSLSLNKSYMS